MSEKPGGAASWGMAPGECKFIAHLNVTPLLGYVSVELQPMVDNPDEQEPAFRLGLHRMPSQELPRLRETAAALAERGGPEGPAAGLDALLDQFVEAG
ncbi:hypothetical protein GCM10023080_020710 [Streptomyces pseudoechinosporeus]